MCQRILLDFNVKYQISLEAKKKFSFFWVGQGGTSEGMAWAFSFVVAFGI